MSLKNVSVLNIELCRLIIVILERLISIIVHRGYLVHTTTKN